MTLVREVTEDLRSVGLVSSGWGTRLPCLAPSLSHLPCAPGCLVFRLTFLAVTSPVPHPLVPVLVPTSSASQRVHSFSAAGGLPSQRCVKSQAPRGPLARLHKHALGRLSHDGGMVGKVMLLLLAAAATKTPRLPGICFDEYPLKSIKLPSDVRAEQHPNVSLIFDAARVLRLCTAQCHCSEASFHAKKMLKWKMPSACAKITMMLPGYLTGQGGQKRWCHARCLRHPCTPACTSLYPLSLRLSCTQPG